MLLEDVFVCLCIMTIKNIWYKGTKMRYSDRMQKVDQPGKNILGN